LHGGSTWTQFLDFRGQVKANLAARFVQALASLDPAEPWRVFPLDVLMTFAPLQVFRKHFGV